mmetsp:Transcript_17523/g.52712  ORF Transcript_17523/g.52712 Transcript_17523/m.52712 type:complete len:626 (-) Transcript_17523:269-2146(-)
MAQRTSGSSRASSSDRSGSGSDDEEPPVTVTRAELVRGHRPVVVSEVPVYVALRDKDGRFFEDKGGSPNVRYRWLRGPVIKPCFFHPHKMSQIRDVAKTFQCYCSKECFLRGWHNLPQHMWGTKPEDDSFEEPIAEWIQVSESRSYCPSQQDIDRPLRLDIIPVLKDGRDSKAGGMSITTGTVIPTPKEARTRRMISNGGTFNAEWLSKQFKVMNWNVLADLYATESVYPYCEKWALSWSWRKHLILKELKSMAADIITLQEVQKDAFDDWFRPQLAEAGYEGIFQQKKRDPIFHRGKYTAEGCATFYKTTRFKRVDKHVIDYDKLSASEVRCLIPDLAAAEKGIQRLSKGNIALAAVLEDMHIKTSHQAQATGPNGGHVLCVVNTHILCDPSAADVKLWQAHLLLQTLKQLPVNGQPGYSGPPPAMPLLICGDFNSTPDSAVYEYLRRGSVQPAHEDLRSDPCGLLKQAHLQLRHNMCMATAYETCNGREAQYTNYTEDFKGTLDYIWFSPDALAVLAISQVDDESQLQQETALPSSTRPSDHVSLVATFMFHDAPADGADSNPTQPAGARGGGLPGPLGGMGGHGGGGYNMGGGHMVNGGGLPGQGNDGLYMNSAALYAAQYL